MLYSPVINDYFLNSSAYWIPKCETVFVRQAERKLLDLIDLKNNRSCNLLMLTALPVPRANQYLMGPDDGKHGL